MSIRQTQGRGQRYDTILDAVGDTPVIRINRIAPSNVNMFVKFEAFNPGGSVKDRLALNIIEAAERDGRLKPGQTVVEATSGNTGIGLAMVCAAKGYPLVVTMAESFSVERRRLMRFLGAKVVLTPKALKGFGMYSKAKELAEENGWFLASQFETADNADIHENTTAREILADFADTSLDYWVTGYGTGGTVSGAGAEVRTGTFERLERAGAGRVTVHYKVKDADGVRDHAVATAAVIGADGAKTPVGRQCIPGAADTPCVAAYHEIVASPAPGDDADFEPQRCDVWYQGRLSPDFYAWVFPHGDKTSIGVGTAQRGFSLRGAVAELRRDIGLGDAATVRCEGAPIPLRPLKRWDDGRNVLLAGDAAGVVAPASGEGIYYAMTGGRLAADAVGEFLETRNPAALRQARKRFMRAHGRVFWVLGMMQRFWYSNDRRRERFVSMCRDPDVQYLTWQAYMHKRLVRAKPAAHMRIFFKDLAHLLGVVRPS